MTDETKTEAPPADVIPAQKFSELQDKHYRTEAELVDLKKRVGIYSTLGDPEAIKAKLTDYDEMRKVSAGSNKEQIDKLLQEKEQEVHGHWKTKPQELEEKLTKSSQVIRRYTILDPAKTLVGNLFTTDARDLVVSHIESVADIDGDQVVIKGSDGKPMRSKADPSRPMGLQEYLSDYAAARPGLALPKGANGAGAPAGSGSANTGGISVEAYKAMTQEQRRQLPIEMRQQLGKEALKTL